LPQQLEHVGRAKELDAAVRKRQNARQRNAVSPPLAERSFLI